MDSRAYLRRQGWRGDGHSLDQTGNGIKKPLLVSKKVDVLGVGLNKHAAVSDQWWLRAYDQGLRDLGTGKEGALANVQKHGVNRGGLYGRFVRGEGVPGTFGEDSASTGDEEAVMAVGTTPEDKAGRKRKREERPEKKSARRKTMQEADPSAVTGPVALQQASGDKKIVSAKAGLNKHKKDIDRQANEYLVEAQRRGIIPTSEDNTRSWPASTRLSRSAGFDETMAKITADAGLTGKSDAKADKYKREKLKRSFKRAARAYLMGEDTPAVEKLKPSKKVRPASTAVGAALEDTNAIPGAAEPPKVKTSKVMHEAPQTVKKPRKLSSVKLAGYTKRAAEKGLSVESYIERREEKYVAKQAEKLATKGNAPHIPADVVRRQTKVAPAVKTTEVERPLFVVDTVGTTEFSILPDDPKFSERAMTAIAQGAPFTILNAAGKETLRWEPDTPIPLDPRIWASVKAHDLPKPIRKARKAWMAVRRDEKKQRKSATADSKGGAAKEAKSKGRRKVEKREAFVRQILVESRKAGRKAEGKTCTVGGVSDVQLVKVTSKNGAFTKDEITSARSVARRALRNVKREERAAKGKGKGYKKQERAEKEIARLAQGIS